MKNHTRILILLTALLLVFTLAACGGGQKEATTAPSGETTAATPAPAQEAAATVPPTPTPEPPTATPTPEPTDTPTPEPTPTPTPEPLEELSGSFKKIEDAVDSYRSKGLIEYTVSGLPDEAQPEMKFTMEFTSEWTKADNPAGYDMAMSMSMSGMNLEGADSEEAQAALQDIQVVMVGDTAYMKFGDQWISMPRDEVDDPDSFGIDAEDFVSGMEDVKRVGEEEINGIDAVHYTFSNIKNYDMILNDMLKEQLKDKDVTVTPTKTQVQGDIWVAKDGGYPVKTKMNLHMELTYSAKGETASQPLIFDFDIDSEVFDVNSDITIEPPEGAAQPGQVNVPGFEPGTFPVPEETEIEGAFGGVTSLVSKLSADEVTAFYDEKLAELGWTKADGPMPTWSKGDNSFTLMITPNDDGTTSILIMANVNQ